MTRGKPGPRKTWTAAEELGYAFQESSPADRQPIPRRNLHEALAERIRGLILDGELAPGARISEAALCTRFDVSRTPVREALKVLTGEGLVTITPNRGASVASLSADELTEVFPVMGALEALAGELAARHITDDEIAGIERLHARMLTHYRAGELQRYFAVNQAIHQAILAAARNQTLAHHYAQLAGRVRLARYRANMSDRRWAQAVAEHERMLAALRARDGSQLGRILKAHIAHKLEAVREALAAHTPGTEPKSSSPAGA